MRYASLLLLAACGRIAFDETSNVDGSVDTPAPNVFSRLVAYGDNTCAEYNGHAYCWGANVSGQIGDGTTMPRPSPTRVTLPDGALQGLTIGETHGCVILSGAAWCWGEHAGLMGPAKPAVQLALSNVTDIAAGKRFTCMVSSGTASCFGADDVG
ncbi:MAG TPA: RCC1 domain-containing protein, partial [Kofleriaceae bacterium]|nr:RCC1 domain-containing protein [Kofleriaceae bacterium]